MWCSTRICVGSLTFLIYINDIINCSSKFQFYLFADDTSILYRNSTSLEAEVNTELIKLCDWLTANKLTLNIRKSNYVLFPSYNKRLLYNPKINIFDHDNGTYSPLDFKESVKYLGIFIDKYLNWKTHIDLIALKISKTIGIIARLRHFVPLSVTTKLYIQSFRPSLYVALQSNLIQTNLIPIKFVVPST